MTETFWNSDPSAPGARNGEIWAELAADIGGLGYWRYDVSTRTLSWSESLGILLGLTGPPNVEAVLASMDGGDGERHRRLVREAVRTCEPFTSQFRQRRADGSWRMFLNRSVCVCGPDGGVRTIRGVVKDITEREIHRVVTESGNDIIVQMDVHGALTYVSPNVTAMTGYTPQELLGLTVKQFILPEMEAAIAAAVLEAWTNPDHRPASVEVAVNHKDGRQIWLESRPAPLLDPATGALIGATDVVRDITERKTADAKLEFAHILLTTQMEASPDGILVVDADRRTLSFNQRFAAMWGIPADQITHAEDDLRRARLIALVKNRDVTSARADFYYANPDQSGSDDMELTDGRIIERYTVPLIAPGGAFLGRAWFYSDVTEQRRSLARAITAASHDALTGLANRAAFVESLRQEIARAERAETGFGVIYLDLDHFKDVNDTLGHPAGDELLKAVAARLRANTRGADTIARFGGDEFAIIVTNLAEPMDIAALADKLIRVIAEPFAVEGGKVFTGASIGIDIHRPEAADADALLAHADLALYEAKARGRGRYQFFTPSMDAEVRSRVAMATELREAIAGDELFLVYQPQVSMITGRMTGVEALLRWRHPRLGVLRPDRFVSTAERMGLIEPLGHWVLWSAIRQARAWLDEGLPLARLSINLSALQFKAPLSLEADISAALLETSLPPGLLELELTEAALMTATRESSEVLLNLRQAGVTVAIDDFGAGYSSLHHLSRFPVDRIKIAETFVGALETSLIDAAIVKAAIGIAKGLNITVMAAGVATRTQFELLKTWGCGEAQGGYVGPPIEAERLPSVLRNEAGATNDQPACEDPAECAADPD